jgi:hypothetical protein
VARQPTKREDRYNRSTDGPWSVLAFVTLEVARMVSEASEHPVSVVGRTNGCIRD